MMQLGDLQKPIDEQLKPLLDQVATWTRPHFDRPPSHALQKALTPQVFDYLREHHPVLVLPRFALVTRHDDVKSVLARDEDFGVTEIYAERMKRTSGPFVLGMERTPQYEREAAWLRNAIHDDDLDRIRQLTREYIDEALTAARRAATGDVVGIDIVTALGRRIPVRLINDYFGVPVGDEAQMMRWMRITFWELFMNLANNPKIRRRAEQACSELNPYLERVIQARRTEIERGAERDDFLSRLIRTRADFGEPAFDDVDVRRNVAGVIIGAVDTINKAATQLVAELLQRPRALQEARRAAERDDLDLVARHAFEALRFDPLNPFLLRVCHRDSIIAEGTARETRIPKGTTVCVATQGAMFDPDVFDKPHQFRVDRPYESYILFGDGQHRCFGEGFNRIILPELLAALARLPNLRRARGTDGFMSFEGPFPDRLRLEFDQPLN